LLLFPLSHFLRLVAVTPLKLQQLLRNRQDKKVQQHKPSNQMARVEAALE
jgi:hypothetical protein